MKEYWKHFKTITIHKWYVLKACFKVGLYWQGITHDLSKYSFKEFFTSAKYFQGDKSPIEAEKAKIGYSVAWQHHKGHNPHHWQYWLDFDEGKLICLPMPPKYLAEMMCDWIGAGKAYNKGKWTVDEYFKWYANHRNTTIIHKSSKAYLDLVYMNSRTEADLYKYINPKRIQESYAQDLQGKQATTKVDYPRWK